MAARLDLNADVGEGFPHDAALMAVVTQANVACGFHAGDAASMTAVCRRAKEHQVSVGAQVSYRDRAGFGRRDVEVDHPTLVSDLAEQVETLRDVAAAVGASVDYLKPHGALYNRVGWDVEQAAAVVEVCLEHRLPLMCLPGSVALESMTSAGGATMREFFADRAYDARGRLVPRGQAGAVITAASVVAARVDQLVASGTVATIDGALLEVDVDTVCLHGDTPDALRLARAVRNAIGPVLR